MWEDAKNLNGGRWVINLDKKSRAVELDRFWLEMVCSFALINCCRNGENLLLLFYGNFTIW